MKLNYSQYCYSEAFNIDDKSIKDNAELQKINETIFRKLNTYENSETIFRMFLETFGNYEESVKCDQCGDYDIKINLEI